VASLLGMSYIAIRCIGLKRRLDLERKRGGRLRRLYERSEREIGALLWSIGNIYLTNFRQNIVFWIFCDHNEGIS
jgi:hypothetical protein